MPAVKRKSTNFEMTSRLTKRAVARILIAVQNKLHEMVMEKIQTEGEYNASEVRQALEHPETMDVVQRNIREEKLRLVDKKHNGPVFKTQMSLIGERNMSPDGRFKEDDGNLDPEEAHLVSNSATYG